MVLIEICMRSTDSRDEPRVIFCDLTQNKSTNEYSLDYVGANEHIRNDVKQQSGRLIEEMKTYKEYESVFRNL